MGGMDGRAGGEPGYSIWQPGFSRGITISFWVPETSIEDKEHLYSSHVCFGPCFIASGLILEAGDFLHLTGSKIHCQGYCSILSVSPFIGIARC